MSFSGMRTRQREAIQEVLEAAERPLSAHEVLGEAQGSVPRLGLATVYRNLNRLLDEGWLVPIDSVGEGRRYERAGKEHHGHYHCCTCDRVYDLSGCAAQAVSATVPAGFTVESHELVVHGRCADCAGAA